MMIVYNVTVKVEQGIASQWLKWLKEEHIPAMISTGCFKRTEIFRLLEVDDTEGPTYAIQYYAENQEVLKLYIEKYATEMRNSGQLKWGNKFVAFRSVLEVVH
jgi:hypothetical protein